MTKILTFFREHKRLCILSAGLLICAVIGAVLLLRGLSSQPPSDDPPQSDIVTETEAVSETETETEAETEVVIELPPPFFDAASDTVYHPSSHDGDSFEAVSYVSDDYRIYAVYPKTDSDHFNDYCQTTVESLITSSEAPETAREGGTTVVTVDYTLYQAQNVYSAVFTRKLSDTASFQITKTVIVLSYNIETNTVYAPLDRYDMMQASELLASKMRAEYEDSFRACGLTPDSAFLDTVCTPDPSSFVNIAVDADNMYFFTVYGASACAELLCAAVPFADMEEYTWAAIEAQKQASQQPVEPDVPPIVYPELPTYDLSAAVPESTAVGNEYFDDAVFIGNSLIVGLQRTVPLGARYFASIGLNVSQVFTKELVPMKSGKIFTISDALATVEFSKVYLMFGINELGWGSIASFIGYYGQIIDRIREINPDAIIYVQSILPINEEKWAKSRDFQSCINNYAVATFNQKILDMCVEKNAAFVNVGEVLRDETGNLFADATSDGIHIGGTYATMWVDYLKTHTVTAP